MDKQTEIETLAAFIESLPGDTYLRDWLASVKHDFDRAIRSDIILEASLSEYIDNTNKARSECLELQKAVKAKREELKQLEEASEILSRKYWAQKRDFEELTRECRKFALAFIQA